MKRIIRAATTDEISARETAHIKTARQIAAEGMVLIKNDGALPLKGKVAALYGYGVRHTCFGGGGSGETRPRHNVCVEEGFLKNGFKVSTQNWLDDFDASYKSHFLNWEEQMRQGMKKLSPMKQMDYAASHVFVPPEGREITFEDAKNSKTDTAVYILTRQTAEGADHKLEKGDYYLTDGELMHLKQLKKLYSKVVLVLNVGGVIDLKQVFDLDLSAVLVMSHGGMTSGDALFDVLAGAVSPCGKLTATWAENYGDYPCAFDYSYLDGNTEEENYREGIFVGYRYFDAFDKKPLCCFGYGLSYTTFEITPLNCFASKNEIKLIVEVKNTGGFSGKEVVQVYLGLPDGKITKEKKSLAAFEKTKSLLPNESQKLELSFDLTKVASFDENANCFLLEKGDYVVYVGNSSENAKPYVKLRLEKSTIVQEVHGVCPPKEKIDEILPQPFAEKFFDLPVVNVDLASLEKKVHDYSEIKSVSNKKAVELAEKLLLKKLVKLIVGASYVGRVKNTCFGACGRTTAALDKFGISDMPMADGPQGLNLTPVSKKPRQNMFNVPVLPAALKYGSFGFLTKLTCADNKKGKKYFQYCTSLPCATLLAQTWDKQAAFDFGKTVGIEMAEFGVAFWLAPALNIHRNPLCGRNYEYFSEDPLLSGLIAAYAVKGVQSVKGRFAVLKHFACNNQECDRTLSSSNLSQRALREIYLKGFEIAVREGKAKGVMSSYNKINGVYASNNFDLLTKVLRCEWGFDGVVMTDWFATGHDQSLDELCCKCGCDLVMPGTPFVRRKIMKAIKKGVITQNDVRIAASRIIAAALEYGENI